MSSRMTPLQMVGCATALALVGTAYGLLYMAERKQSKERKRLGADGSSSTDGGSTVLTTERLIEVLRESAKAAFQLIEQTRKMVHEKHLSTGQPLEACVDELQKDFESASEFAAAPCQACHHTHVCVCVAGWPSLAPEPASPVGVRAPPPMSPLPTRALTQPRSGLALLLFLLCHAASSSSHSSFPMV